MRTPVKKILKSSLIVGIIMLFVGTSISVAYDSSTDEVPHQNNNLFFLNYAFVMSSEMVHMVQTIHTFG